MVRVWEEAILAKTYQGSGKFLPRAGEEFCYAATLISRHPRAGPG